MLPDLRRRLFLLRLIYPPLLYHFLNHDVQRFFRLCSFGQCTVDTIPHSSCHWAHGYISHLYSWLPAFPWVCCRPLDCRLWCCGNADGAAARWCQDYNHLDGVAYYRVTWYNLDIDKRFWPLALYWRGSVQSRLFIFCLEIKHIYSHRPYQEKPRDTLFQNSMTSGSSSGSALGSKSLPYFL